MANNYYWRAVRRLAKKHDVSLSRARKMDWQKEANEERKRRSESHRIHKDISRTSKPSRGGTVRDAIPHRTSGTPKRHTESKKRTRKGIPKVPTRRTKSKLALREYDQIPTYEEEEYGEAEDWQAEWQDDWQNEWEELNDLDDLEGFLIDFEYEEGDKYKEPA